MCKNKILGEKIWQDQQQKLTLLIQQLAIMKNLIISSAQ